MRSIEEIRDLKNYYLTEFYSVVRREQNLDAEFYNDIFDVPQIKTPTKLSRTGGGRERVDVPVSQISAYKITAHRKPILGRKGVSKEAQDSAIKISRMVNEDWIARMMKRNPSPLREFLLNLFLRGEAWWHPVHNERWVSKPIDRNGSPVLFLVPDPMIIYASPNEDENGIPEHVIVWYERMPWLIKQKYPAWNNPKHAGEKGYKRTVDWLEWWEKDSRYFEADGGPVLSGGVQENIYGFPPFVHKLSGFGKESPEGKMEDSVVGILRQHRDLLKRECAITSDVDNAIHMFANRSFDAQPIDDMHNIPDGFAQSYEVGSGMVHELPFGITIKRAEDALPEPALFQYLYTVRADIGRITPTTLTGAPVGETGRLQDITRQIAMDRFADQIKATENSMATVFSMALRMVDKIPKLLPDELSHEDITENYKIDVELKAEDPIQADRLATRGSRLYQVGEIDLMTNLVEYQGYTAERAKEIITNILIDRVTFQNPDVAALMGLIAADEMGMSEEYAFLKQMRQQVEGQRGSAEPLSPTEKRRAAGETKTPQGEEMMDVFMGGYGARRSPTAFNRGAP